jgi:hypothetical protein
MTIEVNQNPHSQLEFRLQKAVSTKMCVGNVRYEFVDCSQGAQEGIMFNYEGWKGSSLLKVTVCFKNLLLCFLEDEDFHMPENFNCSPVPFIIL